VCPYLNNVINCPRNKANLADNIEILAKDLTKFCQI